MEKIEIEEKIVAMLKTVYDPEIPVNVYDLGLIYKIDVSDTGEVVLDMTLTAPNCPAAGTEHFLHGSTRPRYSLLGQRLEPLHLFHLYS